MKTSADHLPFGVPMRETAAMVGHSNTSFANSVTYAYAGSIEQATCHIKEANLCESKITYH
jgi:hypothetical protein